MSGYQYSKTTGDFFLELFKKLAPNPEFRHNQLPNYAKLMALSKLIHKGITELETTLKFSDKSMPLTLHSPIVLAAGGNKSGANIADFSNLGFGGVTVGTATKESYSGNSYRPRLRMIPRYNAIQNSMGLNNPGIEEISNTVDMQFGRCHKEKMSIGISIADSPDSEGNENKIEEILFSFRKAYGAADYVEINVSCPNTGDNRLDWQKDFLQTLLSEIMEIRKQLVPRKAVFVKLSPDMSQSFLDKTLEVINDSGVTGLVLFNTFPAERAKFLNMEMNQILPVSNNGKLGGISGEVLFKNTLPAVKFIKEQLPNLSVMAVGGIDHGRKVFDLLEAGADAVQCYTVLAYRWNAIHKMNKELLQALREKGFDSVTQFQAA